MALIFEYEKDIETGRTPFMCHEEDSTIYNYFIDGEAAKDRSTLVALGQYAEVTFGDEDRHLTTRAVERIGVKNFPGVGGIGFYKDIYNEESRIVAPIHSTTRRYSAPVLESVEIADGKLHIVITPPSDISYTCYRVVLRQGTFAFEYILYKTEYSVDVSFVKGEYNCYCIGYDEDNGTVSDDSNIITLTVTEGNDDWAPRFETVAYLEQRISNLEDEIGDIGAELDEINGVVV